MYHPMVDVLALEFATVVLVSEQKVQNHGRFTCALAGSTNNEPHGQIKYSVHPGVVRVGFISHLKYIKPFRHGCILLGAVFRAFIFTKENIGEYKWKRKTTTSKL